MGDLITALKATIGGMATSVRTWPRIPARRSGSLAKTMKITDGEDSDDGHGLLGREELTKRELKDLHLHQEEEAEETIREEEDGVALVEAKVKQEEEEKEDVVDLEDEEMVEVEEKQEVEVI